jgi:diacylglycerol kinase (ATP)
LAFYVAGARALPELTEYRMTLKFDQNEPFEVSAYNIVVSNGSTIAGGIPVAPEASLDDGLMDILVIPSIPLAKLALTLPLILAGRHVGNTDLIIRKARTFRVSSSPNFALNTDGEVIGEAPALYDVLPKSLRVIANPAALGTGRDEFV